MYFDFSGDNPMERISSPFVTPFLHQRIMRRIAFVVIVVYAVGGIFNVVNGRKTNKSHSLPWWRYMMILKHAWLIW